MVWDCNCANRDGNAVISLNDFIIEFTESSMTTSGFPLGAQAVWPSGAYYVNDDVS